MQGMKRAPSRRKAATSKQLLFKANLFKEWLKKFVTLLTKEAGKTAMNDWENDDPDILWALISVYKKIRTILFPYLQWRIQKNLGTLVSAGVLGGG